MTSAEKAKLVNFGSADVSIAGYCLADRDGNNHSAPLKQGTIIPAGGSVTVWAAPGTPRLWDTRADWKQVKRRL